MILFTTLIFVSGCTEFAILMSGSSLAISQNTYAKVYNGIDVLTIMNTVNSSMYGLNDYNFYNLDIFSKSTLMIFMIIGRVELLTLIIISKKFLFKN